MNIVETFTQIRDIPYSIPLSPDEKNTCCSGKCIRLLNIFQENGLDARYRICSFSWSSLNLPAEIVSLPHNDLSTHVYIEVLINGVWLNVDPTWDIGLQSILPVNEWDGVSNTQIAVPVIELFDLEKSAQIMTETDPKIVEDDLAKNRVFYSALNDYFDKIRT